MCCIPEGTANRGFSQREKLWPSALHTGGRTVPPQNPELVVHVSRQSPAGHSSAGDLPPGSCDIPSNALGSRLNTTNPTVHRRFASDKAYSSSSPSFSNSDFLCELHPNYAKLKHAGGCYGFHYQHGRCFSTSTVYPFCGGSGAWSRVERDELL